MTEPPKLLTIPAAARAAEVPERSLYRAVDSGEIPSSIGDGTKLVALDNVVAWREARRAVRPPPPASQPPATPPLPALPELPATPLPPPAASGNVAAATGGRPLGNALVASSDGALAARLFAAFDEGAAPTDLVTAMELPPATVLSYFRTWKELRTAGGSDRRSLADRITSIESRIDALARELEEATWGGVLATEVKALKARVEQIAEFLAALPLMPQGQFTCEGCGATGFVETLIRCTSCGTNSGWGFRPKRQ